MTNPKTHLLNRAASIYDAYKEKLLTQKNSHSLIDEIGFIEDISRFAWKIHTGRFIDPTIEARLLQIGENLNQHVDIDSGEFTDCLSNLNIQPKQPNKRNVLHIVTSGYAASGHTKLLNNIVQMDSSSVHSLIVSNQDYSPFPDWLTTTFQESDRQLFHLKHENVLIRALLARLISQKTADVIFLYVHPDDTIPLLAFSVEDCPPVIMVNHADHAYWLGSSVADLIVNLRDRASELSYSRRAARKCMLLPLPLQDSSPKISKQAARSELNIPEDQIVAISIGVSYKFVPNADSDFFKTMRKALDEIPELYLKVIGISEDDHEDLEKLGYVKHERLQLLGIINQPEKYQIAADIVIDPLPYGSYTSLLDSIVLGCYPFMMKSAIPLFNLADDPGLKEMDPPAENEEHFISALVTLCKSKEELEEKTRLIRENLLNHHSGEGWFKALNDIYQYADSVKHSAKSAGKNSFMNDAEDISASELSETKYELESNKLLYGIVDKSPRLTFTEIIALFFVVNALSYPRTFRGIKIFFRMLKNKLTGQASH